MITTDLSEWSCFLSRSLSDIIPNRADLVVLPGQTSDNKGSSFDSAVRLYNQGVVPKIGITWTDESVLPEMHREFEKNLDKNLVNEIIGKLKDNVKKTGALLGYEGHESWIKDLYERGVPKDNIVLMKPELNQPCIHTGSEGVGLVDYCVREGLENVILVAPTFHLPRVVITYVSKLIKSGRDEEVNYYFAQGSALPWNEKVVHSQGVVKDTRLGIFKEELDRIKKYSQGDNPQFLGLEKITGYLDKRDARCS